MTIETAWTRLRSLAQEQQTALLRTAFSTIVRETQDLACGVFNTKGQMVAQSQSGTPGHINAMATGVELIVRDRLAGELAEGDVVVTNDPWLTTGQINDITVLTPVFLNGSIAGYLANTCHAPDIGGRLLSAGASEVYEEGLRLPPMKLQSKGLTNSTLVQVIETNVRTPRETMGDIHAQMACNEVGASALRDMMQELNLDSIDEVSNVIMDRSEAAMRRAIEGIPDGIYRSQMDSDGIDGQPIHIEVAVTIEGSNMTMDFAGSSDQSRKGVNVVLNYTRAYASFAAKAILSPSVPHNLGSFRPITVVAPKGSILNCTEPSAVGARHIVGHFVPSVVISALAPVLERSIAPGADPIWISVWRGQRTGAVDVDTYDRESMFNFTLFQAGGMGGRPTSDGPSAMGFPSGVAGVSTEVFESMTPLQVVSKELIPDSGGPGQARGGLGQKVVIKNRAQGHWTASVMADRINHPAQGLSGGLPGGAGSIRLQPKGSSMAAKHLTELPPDASVVLSLPGGGGHGDPRARASQLVLADVVGGYVTQGSALEHYGAKIEYSGPPDAVVRPPGSYRIAAGPGFGGSTGPASTEASGDA